MLMLVLYIKDQMLIQGDNDRMSIIVKMDTQLSQQSRELMPRKIMQQ